MLAANLQHLKVPFMREELNRAVFDLNDEKLPGTNGFTGGFFKHFLHITEEDLFMAINQLFYLRRE